MKLLLAMQKLNNYRMKLSSLKLLGPMIKPAKQRSEEIGEDKVHSFSHAV